MRISDWSSDVCSSDLTDGLDILTGRHSFDLCCWITANVSKIATLQNELCRARGGQAATIKEATQGLSDEIAHGVTLDIIQPGRDRLEDRRQRTENFTKFQGQTSWTNRLSIVSKVTVRLATGHWSFLSLGDANIDSTTIEI